MTTINGRTADHPIDPLFLERWSPRSFSGEAIEPGEFFTMLEAARWAPSSSNAQPWRFLYARRETPYWDEFLGLLSESNQAWAVRAAVLVFILSKRVVRRAGSDHDQASYTHSFDAGAAWAHLALQATRLGWHAHGIGGFDKERAPLTLRVPDSYRVEAGVAIGRLGSVDLLTADLKARERPSLRQPLSNTAFEGRFPV